MDSQQGKVKLRCRAQRGKVMISHIKKELDGDCKGIYVEAQSCIFIAIYCSDIPF